MSVLIIGFPRFFVEFFPNIGGGYRLGLGVQLNELVADAPSNKNRELRSRINKSGDFDLGFVGEGGADHGLSFFEIKGVFFRFFGLAHHDNAAIVGLEDLLHTLPVSVMEGLKSTDEYPRADVVFLHRKRKDSRHIFAKIKAFLSHA